MFDEKLGRALNFTEAELAANRDGYMTLVQKTRMYNKGDEQVGFLGCVTFLLLILMIFMLPLLFSGHWIGVLVGGGVLLTLVLVAHKWNDNRFKLLTDYGKNDILRVEGRIQLRHVDDLLPARGSLSINGLKFRINDAALPLLKNEAEYCVYYTPNTLYLLAIEAVETDDDFTAFDPALGRRLGFDENDLAANRDGIITENQRGRLFRSRYGNSVGFSLAVVIVWLTFAAFIIWVSYQVREPIFALVCLFIPLLMVIGGVSEPLDYRRKMRADLRDAIVKMSEGNIRRSASKYGYHVMMKDGEFEVKADAYFTFSDAQRYRIYYLPNTRQILSAEPLKDKR